jgi:hypothetical protein
MASCASSCWSIQQEARKEGCPPVSDPFRSTTSPAQQCCSLADVARNAIHSVCQVNYPERPLLSYPKISTGYPFLSYPQNDTLCVTRDPFARRPRVPHLRGRTKLPRRWSAASNAQARISCPILSITASRRWTTAAP